MSVYADTNRGSDISPQRKSRTGIIISYGNAPSFWTSQSEKLVSLSISEAEYMALSDAAKNVTWLRCLLTELEMHQDCTVVHQENSRTIDCENGGSARHYSRLKHIDMRHHFRMQMIQEGHTTLVKVPIALILADFLTKPLASQSLSDALTRLYLLLSVQRNN